MTPAQIRQHADAAVARSLAAIRASKAAHTVRTNAGARNSAADQARLDVAHDALVQAGATHGTNATAQDAGAAPEHQALLDAAHDSLVQAGAACDSADDPVTSGTRATDPSSADNLRDNTSRLTPPDPYRRALQKRSAGVDIRAAMHPTADPAYDPYTGPGANGHAIALAVRALSADPDADVALIDLPCDEHGTPNPYSAEAIAAYQRARGM